MVDLESVPGLTVRDGYALFFRPECPLSQWHPAPFQIGERRFATAEHWMMYAKAKLFDPAIADDVLAADTSKAARALGRRIKGFDESIWKRRAPGIVMAGTAAKFFQNVACFEVLKATEALVLAEASPYDKIWGIGLAADHPDATRPERWPGTNYLGRALARVREHGAWMFGVIRTTREFTRN